MSSPFSIFRKHQRAMMAVLGILCMFAFTFTGFVGGLGSFVGSGRQDPVAVETSFGDYRDSDLQEMRRQRTLVKRFLTLGISATFGEQMQRVEPAVSQILDFQVIGPSAESSLVESRILAREAKREGVVISDESITDYLQEVNRQVWLNLVRMPPIAELRSDQLQAVLHELSRNGPPVNRLMIYNALRIELLANQMRQMFAASLQTTPAERWDFYQRLKRRVRVELAPVAAADLASRVSNPPEDVARKFFGEYKDREPEPGSPEPGFKTPRRAAFQYFEIHYQDFYHPEEVSAADVQQEYEKSKDTKYLYNESQSSADEEDEAATEPGKEGQGPEKTGQGPEKKTAEPQKKPDEQSREHRTSGGTKSDAKEAAEKQAGTTPTAAPEKSQKATDSKDSPSDEPDSAKPENEQKDENGSDASDINCGGSDADDESEQQADAKQDSPAEKPSTTSAPGAEKPATEPTKEPKADGAEPASTAPPAPDEEAKPGAVPMAKPAEKTGPAEKSEPAAPKKSTAPPLSDRFLLPTDITKGPNPKYEPLWQAEPKIRKLLAESKAVQAMEKTVLELKAKLRPYADARVVWESRKAQQPTTSPPAPPDFQAIAKNVRGVTAGRIPLSAEFQISQVPGIGGSLVGGQPFVAFALAGLKVYHSVESQDNEGNRYLFWKTDDQDARVPKFDEIRDEVVQTWKLREARTLMIEKADSLAKKARESHKSLKDALAGEAGVTVSETPAFSWVTGGSAGQFNQQSEPRLSEVPGTVDIGDEFMKKVFNLQVGDVGIAENHPQTVAYVVRMTTSEPPQMVLRDMFVADRFESYESVARETQRSLYQQWLRDQLAAFRVHWVRPPYDEVRFE